jgi:hypothetical protein
MQRQTTSHMENKNKRLSSGDQVAGRQRKACTPPGAVLRNFWGLCSISRFIRMAFVADLITCKLDFA